MSVSSDFPNILNNLLRLIRLFDLLKYILDNYTKTKPVAIEDASVYSLGNKVDTEPPYFYQFI